MSQMGDSQLICSILGEHFTAAGFEPKRLAELGVHRGETSAALLRAFPQARLIMVDEYASYLPDHRYRKSGDGCAKFTPKQQDENRLAAHNAVLFAHSRAMMMRCSTLDAAANLMLGQASVDAVLVDADHTFEAVRDDTAAWWGLLRSGGVMAWHDCDHPRDRSGKWGVRRAIEEHAAREKLSWQQRGSLGWMVKP